MGYIAAIGAIAGGAISAYGSSSASSDSAEQRDAAYNNGIKAINNLTSKASSGDFHGYGLEDVFGTKADSSAALYDPVALSESQGASIMGNLANYGIAANLADYTNDANLTQDIKRISSIFPNFEQNLNQFSGVTSALLNGQNPYGSDDAFGIVSNRSSFAAAAGTPGGSGPATNKDLGLTRLQLGTQGASMFQDFIRTADAISPLNSRFRVQQSYLTPSERLEADLKQQENAQAGGLSKAYLDAGADPAAAGLFNLDFSSKVGLASAKLGSAVNLSNPYAALGQGVSSAASLYANKQQENQRQNQYGYSGGTYTPSSK